MARREPLSFEFEGHTIWFELESVDADVETAMTSLSESLQL